jgi:hypothetical protein
VPNIYRLVREAIDRGVPLDEVQPGNKITQELKKFVVPGRHAAVGDVASPAGAPQKKLKVPGFPSWAS